MNGVANGVFTGDTLLGINNAPWVDWSEQAIITGWSAFTTKSIRYKVVGNMVFVMYLLQGTSNSTSTNFTLPFASVVSNTGPLNYCLTQDNGSFSLGYAFITFGSLSNILSFNRISAINATTGALTITGTYTASGTKLVQGQIYYQISQ